MCGRVQLFDLEVYPKLDSKCVQEFKLKVVRSRASHCTPSAAIGAMQRRTGTYAGGYGTVGTYGSGHAMVFTRPVSYEAA